MFENWTGAGLAGLMFLYTFLRSYLPPQLHGYMAAIFRKLISWIDPYINIKIHEYTAEGMKRNEAYAAVEAYLSASCAQNAQNLNAEFGKDSRLLVSLDNNERVTENFQGAKLWWTYRSLTLLNESNSPSGSNRKRYYKLAFHKQQRDLVMASYLPHVLTEGRQRKLFTIKPSKKPGMLSSWSHVVFEHPSTFDTLAMASEKKEEIKNDLRVFREGREYYSNMGKAWKRGYLLHGPPGTGKSTMVAAMANLLDYDIYDLELAAVKSNSELRKLFIETMSKSIIVIEDVDCSFDLTGNRKKRIQKVENETNVTTVEQEESSKVTLSGLLNFIDGIGSACSGERLIVFTTNQIEKLDPALIRRGRMDKHIEMSYCGFEAFKVFAKNYLDIDSHPLFETVRKLLEVVKITPADVAESLMRKSVDDGDETCLGNLIRALKEPTINEEVGEGSNSTESVKTHN